MIASAQILGSVSCEQDFHLFLIKAYKLCLRKNKSFIYVLPKRVTRLNNTLQFLNGNYTIDFTITDKHSDLKKLVKNPNIIFYTSDCVDVGLSEVNSIISNLKRFY